MKYLFLVLALSFCALANAEIKEKTVEYSANGVNMKGYLVWDDAKGENQPGVLVVHEWWGLNDFARQRARKLAELGYTALAVDMFGDGKSVDHPNDAKGFMKTMQEEGVAEARFKAALSALEDQSTVDSDKIAAVGYCFGGGVILNMVRQGLPLKAAVSFHGSLDTATPAVSGKVVTPILILHGRSDNIVGLQSLMRFQLEMKEANADVKYKYYTGAKHGFTNPDSDRIAKAYNLDVAYDPKADAESWEALQDFLKTAFAK